MAPNSPACSLIQASMAGARSTAPLNRSNSVLIVATLESAGVFSHGVLRGTCWFQGTSQNAMRERSEEHTSELQSHSDLHSFPTRRSSDLFRSHRRDFGISGGVLSWRFERYLLVPGYLSKRHER